ncbi:hypothetical protein PUN28_004721 [Cardiocondyla obscurior]|uniref:Uncharacterized protein n=1 Tax=Cardiocondyla obscurior TaxID=286306 RepID=A0AAW2GCW7_9HYME
MFYVRNVQCLPFQPWLHTQESRKGRGRSFDSHVTLYEAQKARKWPSRPSGQSNRLKNVERNRIKHAFKIRKLSHFYASTRFRFSC